MSLTKNIGIGKEAFYNPFNHYKGDGEEWFKEMLEYNILPQELFGLPVEYTYEQFVSEANSLILRADWNSLISSVYLRIDKQEIELTQKSMGIAVYDAIHKLNKNIYQIQDWRSVYIEFLKK